MTVSTTIIKSFGTGDGSTATFAYQFKIIQDSDLEVFIRTNATGAESAAKVLGTDYSMTGAGVATGGTVTFLSGKIPISGQTIVLRRNVPKTQVIDYIANDPFPAETHEEGLDRGIMVAQQNFEEVERSIKLSKTNTMTSTEFKVGATERANKVLSFDSTGELSVTQELGTFKGNSATTTTAAYAIRDIVKGTTTAQLNNIYICIQASPVGTALTNTAYWVLIVDAVSAAASAATATTKAAEAVTAQNAAVVAQNASVAAKDLSVTAKNESVTAKDAAEAAFDSFDDRYLGAKSSAPSTDNDGNALLTGALYFNSSSSQIFNWTGSAWESLKPSSSEQTNINALGASAVIADMAILATDAIVADMAILGTDALVADMAILATDAIVADMAILATDAIVADMAILGSNEIVADMDLLGTSANVTAMGLLGVSAVITDMGILGTAAIVEDMALLGTSANVSAMDVIGTSTVVANIATVAANVAGVNSFAERYRVGSSNPTSDLNEGDLFYNTSSNVVLFYNGSAWITIVAGNVTQTGSETLTNKTLTAPVISGSASSAGTILFKEDTDNGTNAVTLKGAAATADVTVTLPAATDTLVGKATTDTLTNKTLTLPKINENVAVTSTATELNLLDGVSGLVQADLTKLAAVDSTAAELNIVDALSRGSIIYGNASAATAILTKGTATQVLTSDGTDISWSDAGAGGIEWQTIVTGSTLTAVAGRGYWINTTSNACTITLPSSASNGDQIILKDYARTWGTNKISIDSNGLKYQGETDVQNVDYNTDGQTINIVYSGATKGWLPLEDDSVIFAPLAPPTQRGIFAFGYASGDQNMRNLMNSSGVIATDVSGAGTSRYSVHAVSYGGDKAVYAFGINNSGKVNMSNLVSNSGVIASDTTGVGTSTGQRAAAGYGGDKGVFCFGYLGGGNYTGATNLASNQGVISTDVTIVSGVTARTAPAATAYGLDTCVFAYGGFANNLNMSNKVNNQGVMTADISGVGSFRWYLSAVGYGSDKGIFAWGASNDPPSYLTRNLVSNTGVISADVSTTSGTARHYTAASTYGGDKAAFAYGTSNNPTTLLNMKNFVSNVGVISADITGVGTARNEPGGVGYSYSA